MDKNDRNNPKIGRKCKAQTSQPTMRQLYFCPHCGRIYNKPGIVPAHSYIEPYTVMGAPSMPCPGVGSQRVTELARNSDGTIRHKIAPAIIAHIVEGFTSGSIPPGKYNIQLVSVKIDTEHSDHVPRIYFYYNAMKGGV